MLYFYLSYKGYIKHKYILAERTMERVWRDNGESQL